MKTVYGVGGVAEVMGGWGDGGRHVRSVARACTALPLPIEDVPTEAAVTGDDRRRAYF